MKNKFFILIFLGIVVEIYSFGQNVKTSVSDSISLTLEYDKKRHQIDLCFFNRSNSIVSFPWNDAYPYIYFFEQPLEISVYVGKNDTLKLLKMVGNEPSFDGNITLIELKPSEKVIKNIHLNDLITEKEFEKYEYLYVKYKYRIDLSNSINLRCVLPINL